MGQANSQLSQLGCCTSGNNQKKTRPQLSAAPKSSVGQHGIPGPHMLGDKHVTLGRHSMIPRADAVQASWQQDGANHGHSKQRAQPNMSQSPPAYVQPPAAAIPASRDRASSVDHYVKNGYEVISDPTYGAVHKFNDRDLSLKPTPGLETVMEEFYAPGRGLMDAATKEQELRSAAAAATTTTTAAAATATRRPPRRKVLAELAPSKARSNVVVEASSANLQPGARRNIIQKLDTKVAMLMGEEPPKARWIYGEYEDEEEEEEEKEEEGEEGKGSRTNHRGVGGGGKGVGQSVAGTEAIQGAGGSNQGQASVPNNGYTVILDC